MAYIYWAFTSRHWAKGTEHVATHLFLTITCIKQVQSKPHYLVEKLAH